MGQLERVGQEGKVGRVGEINRRLAPGRSYLLCQPDQSHLPHPPYLFYLPSYLADQPRLPYPPDLPAL